MVRVEVHNFQSIEDAVVEIDGFSVVVGRSNIGKSALVRAIKAALTGAPAENYVRHGSQCQRLVKGAKSCKCFCSVRIQGPGLDLLWEKGDAINRYVHNGAEHTVVGKGTPDFLGPGFAPIFIGGDTAPTLLQVADQFRPLFILDRSGTAVADVLSDVAKLDQINEASRSAERDRRERSAERKLREKDLNDLEQTLVLYDGLEAAVARVQAVEGMAEGVAALELKLAAVDRFAVALQAVTGSIRTLAPIETLEVPSPAMVIEQSARLRALTGWRRSFEARKELTASLEQAAGIAVPDCSSVIGHAESLAQLERWRARLVAVKTVFTRFKAVEDATVSAIGPLEASYATYRTMSVWSERVSGLEGALARLQKSLVAAEADEKTLLAEFKALEVCPTCRQPIAIAGHLHPETLHA